MTNEYMYAHNDEDLSELIDDPGVNDDEKADSLGDDVKHGDNDDVKDDNTPDESDLDGDDPVDYRQLYEDLQKEYDKFTDKIRKREYERSTEILSGFVSEAMDHAGFSEEQAAYFTDKIDWAAYIKDDGTYLPKVFDVLREEIKTFSYVAAPKHRAGNFADPGMANGHKNSPAPVSNYDKGRKLFGRIGK